MNESKQNLRGSYLKKKKKWFGERIVVVVVKLKLNM